MKFIKTECPKPEHCSKLSSTVKSVANDLQYSWARRFRFSGERMKKNSKIKVLLHHAQILLASLALTFSTVTQAVLPAGANNDVVVLNVNLMTCNPMVAIQNAAITQDPQLPSGRKAAIPLGNNAYLPEMWWDEANALICSTPPLHCRAFKKAASGRIVPVVPDSEYREIKASASEIRLFYWGEYDDSFASFDRASGRLVALSENGLVTQLSWNADGTLKSSKDPLGRTTAYSYDVGKTTIVEPDGHRLAYVSTNGRLTSVYGWSATSTPVQIAAIETDPATLKLKAITDKYSGDRVEFSYNSNGTLANIKPKNANTGTQTGDSQYFTCTAGTQTNVIQADSSTTYKIQTAGVPWPVVQEVSNTYANQKLTFDTNGLVLSQVTTWNYLNGITPPTPETLAYEYLSPLSDSSNAPYPTAVKKNGKYYTSLIYDARGVATKITDRLTNTSETLSNPESAFPFRYLKKTNPYGEKSWTFLGSCVATVRDEFGVVTDISYGANPGCLPERITKQRVSQVFTYGPMLGMPYFLTSISSPLETLSYSLSSAGNEYVFSETMIPSGSAPRVSTTTFDSNWNFKRSSDPKGTSSFTLSGSGSDFKMTSSYIYGGGKEVLREYSPGMNSTVRKDSMTGPYILRGKRNTFPQ